MSRRRFLRSSDAAATACLSASSQVQSGVRGIKPLKVSGAKIFIVRVGGRYPVLVQLLTDQGVTGVGDAAVAEALTERYPIVKTAPLPVGAQFLNVIESVFSGMARAIIHNSDSFSVEAAKDAIDRYFAERNEYFRAHPKRAGHKVWGQERVQSEFHESNNCKDPLYCW